ncbi:hypothetical protein [Bradyrhizobium sp. RDM4]|uniref:hypothetical protein n=1 Tax=Bradyrhizobium sp. RDM4 TaxID=3378765 RepID=UPI0038FC3A83
MLALWTIRNLAKLPDAFKFQVSHAVARLATLLRCLPPYLWGGRTVNLNLECDVAEQVRVLDPAQWSNLQTEICLKIANAKVCAFVAEADHVAGLVRFGLLNRAAAADHLHTAALYNQLYLEYGIETIQKIMAAGLAEGVA